MSPLYPFDLAVARVKAARKAIDATGTGVLLTARAECHLTGHPEAMDESVRRIAAYADAGADVLYAPESADNRGYGQTGDSRQGPSRSISSFTVTLV